VAREGGLEDALPAAGGAEGVDRKVEGLVVLERLAGVRLRVRDRVRVRVSVRVRVRVSVRVRVRLRVRVRVHVVARLGAEERIEHPNPDPPRNP